MYDPSSFGRAISISSQTSSPASQRHSDAFQQPFASQTLQGQSSLAETAPQGVTSGYGDSSFGTSGAGVTSAFAQAAFPTAQSPQQAQHAAGNLNETGAEPQLAKPESARKLQEAGVQPLPHSAFAAEHKQEPTAFSIPAAQEVTSQTAVVPEESQHVSSFDHQQHEQMPSQQQSSLGTVSQHEQLVPDVQHSANFATHHEPDFTDLNPLSPKLNKEPAQQGEAQRNPFEQATSAQQPAVAAMAVAETFEDDFAEPSATASQPPTAAQPPTPAVPALATTQPHVAQPQHPSTQQVSQPGTASNTDYASSTAPDQTHAVQQQLSGLSLANSQPQQQINASEPVRSGSARSAAGVQQLSTPEQQQPGSARSQTSQQAFPQDLQQQQQQPGSARSQASSAGMASVQQPGVVKSQAREQTFAPQQQQQQPGAVASQGKAASTQAASQADELFVKPTDFDTAVDTRAGNSTAAPSGAQHQLS